MTTAHSGVRSRRKDISFSFIAWCLHARLRTRNSSIFFHCVNKSTVRSRTLFYVYLDRHPICLKMILLKTNTSHTPHGSLNNQISLESAHEDTRWQSATVLNEREHDVGRADWPGSRGPAPALALGAPSGSLDEALACLGWPSPLSAARVPLMKRFLQQTQLSAVLRSLCGISGMSIFPSSAVLSP